MFTHSIPQKPTQPCHLDYVECLTHGFLCPYVCLEPTCLDSNQHLLCKTCLDDHPTYHKHALISDVFSDKLLKGFKEFVSKFESQILDSENARTANIEKIDEIFNLFEKSILNTFLNILHESRERMKQILSNNFVQASKLDTLQKELTNFTCESVASVDEIKNHVKTFGVQENTISQIRKLCTEKSAFLAAGMAQRLTKLASEKLSYLQNKIKQFIEEDLSNEKLKQPIDIFGYCISNATSYLSSENPESLKLVRTLTTSHENRAIYKVLPLENERFVTCSGDSTIRIWGLDTTVPQKVLEGHTRAVMNIIILKNGKLCSCGSDNTIKIWNMEEGTLEQTLFGHSGLIWPLLELPNNILVSGGETQILFWNLSAPNKGKLMKEWKIVGKCCSMIIISDHEFVCGVGSEIRIFRIDGDGTPLKKLRGHTEVVVDVLLHGESRYLLSSSQDNTTRMWDTVVLLKFRYQISKIHGGNQREKADVFPPSGILEVM